MCGVPAKFSSLMKIEFDDDRRTQESLREMMRHSFTKKHCLHVSNQRWPFVSFEKKLDFYIGKIMSLVENQASIWSK